jgi:predicted membrane-bound mannosyltransferase
MEDFLKLIAGILFIVLLLAIAGFLNIWALNTLFPVLNIPFNFYTWIASIILFGSLTQIKNRKD